MRLKDTDHLRQNGVSEADIKEAILFQSQQRRAGAPVLTLAQIVGLTPARNLQHDGPGRLLAQTALAPPRPRHGGAHRSFSPVRASSILASSPAELDFIRPTNKPTRARLVKLAYKAFESGRAIAARLRASPGLALTALEHQLARFSLSARHVLLKLIDQEAFFKGRLFPSYETIASWTSLSRTTVHRTINLLRHLGLLEWTRRYEYDPERRLSEQTSNLYRLAAPNELAAILGIEEPPIPDDVRWASNERCTDQAVMLASLPKPQMTAGLPIDRADRIALARAAICLSNSDLDGSHSDTETLPELHYIKKDRKEAAQRAQLRQP